MAFCDLKPVRVFDENSGCTFIIGDMFAVYSFGTDLPLIFSWDMIREVAESKKVITVRTEKSKYTISKSSFLAREDYFRAIAIIENNRRSTEFPYIHERRILPLKDRYISCAPLNDAYTGQDIIDENDAAAAFITMMNVKLSKLLWLVAMLIMLLTFALIHFFVGITRSNVLYFIPISVAVGGIITLIVYLICHAAARSKYQKLSGSDPASEEIISFLVCQHGFAACESCIYDQQELIPWHEIDYFIETDKMFIFYKDASAVVYMPKKAFDKKHLGGVADTISLHLEQK